MKMKFFPYRFADAVLEHPDFGGVKGELLKIIGNAPVPLLDPDNRNTKKGGVKHRSRKGIKGDSRERWFFLPVDQKTLNSYFDKYFEEAGWELQPAVVNEAFSLGPDTKLRADYQKLRVQVEVQFGNMARWYADVFKFQLSYSLGQIDVAVLVVPTQKLANFIDENVAYFERVARELPHAKMSLTLPIFVLGIEPNDFSEIKACYNSAAENAVRWQAEKGKSIVSIAFDDRVHEEPIEDTE